MDINRTNYETWVVDWLDNNLTKEEVDNLLKISLDVLSVNEDSHLTDDIDSSIDEVDEDISDEDPLDWSFDS